MKKVTEATQMIEKRLAHADHVLAGIPGERQMAEELGMSRTTVRMAIQRLIERGTLVRHGNGRLAVPNSPCGQVKKRVIGFVAPYGYSGDCEQWFDGVKAALEGHPVTLRTVHHAHWADPALPDAIAGFDGIFFVAPSSPIPDWLIAKMKEPGRRVVILDQDNSAAGLPSVTLFPPAAERKLFDHLVKLGHRRIDCLNTQAEDAVVAGRIAAWKSYLREHDLPGQLRSLSVRKPFESAYQVVRDALQEGRPVGSALFCTTGPAAIGAMRALQEGGLEIGVDVSVCAVNGEGAGKYLLRSLTALESPPRALYLRRAVEWILGGGDWEGPLLIQPDDVPLFEGESTGPAPESPVVSLVPQKWNRGTISSPVQAENRLRSHKAATSSVAD